MSAKHFVCAIPKALASLYRHRDEADRPHTPEGGLAMDRRLLDVDDLLRADA
ncbi:MAG: hypothetical protein R3D27_11085 [Hyphomicrobiaceae bacterium]